MLTNGNQRNSNGLTDGGQNSYKVNEAVNAQSMVGANGLGVTNNQTGMNEMHNNMTDLNGNPVAG